MNITPLPVGFGVAVHDLDLRQLDASTAAALRAALLEHGLLVIRDQSLTPEAQVAASEVFGEVEQFPHRAPEWPPQIFPVATRGTEGYTEVGRYWHSDGSFREVPTAISLWHSLREPERGGETLFTDLRQAYAALPDELKQRVEGVLTIHRNGVIHPLVMPHPASGAPSIYLNLGLTAGIVGYPPVLSASMMATLDRHLSRPGATYCHHWQAGDVVVADNYRIAHQATPIAPDQHRLLHRTTVSGEGVLWGA
ncbi:MAG: TauD/TfdA dioxygenase family protein [Sphingomonadaceae bacterium]